MQIKLMHSFTFTYKLNKLLFKYKYLNNLKIDSLCGPD